MNILQKKASQIMMDLVNTPRGTTEWEEKSEIFNQSVLDLLSTNKDKLDPVIKKTIQETKEFKDTISLINKLRKTNPSTPMYEKLSKKINKNINKLHSWGYIGLIVTR